MLDNMEEIDMTFSVCYPKLAVRQMSFECSRLSEVSLAKLLRALRALRKKTN